MSSLHSKAEGTKSFGWQRGETTYIGKSAYQDVESVLQGIM